MSRATFIVQHRFAPADRLFFDTNIWLALYDCRSDPHKQGNVESLKIYGGAVRRARQAQSAIFTHPFVVSEFVNRLLRDEHRFLRELSSADRDFKTWRRSGDYQRFAAQVAQSAREFLNFCNVIEDNFDKSALLSRLQNFEDDARDLNDEFLLEICARHGLVLVTHDGDFQHSDISLLTANKTYLK